MLTPEEESTLKDQLKREPSPSEYAVIDALWSEHCSYKSSKRWFHLFKTNSERVALGIGEGAGLIDVGDGYVIGLGLESHNHPSAIDPFNGAATGVGGIIRDIVSQGCRPIALLDCLRFAPPDQPRQRLLLDQVVLGISSYGNCVGIPNLGGDLEFDPEFKGNPLVNAMCVGVVKKDQIIRSVASNPDDILILFGSTTGRDGIGGVTFASEELDEEQQSSRSSVQIGDPLTEKLLIDAVIELRDNNLLNGLQDLGGGGLACAAIEMAEKGGTGLSLDLELVQVREEAMQPWEILISESQERMLAVVNPSNKERVTSVLDKYGLRYGVVGRINESQTFQGKMNKETIAELPVDFVINGFPEPQRIEGNLKSVAAEPKKQYVDDKFIHLLTTYNISSKSSVYEQYDQQVQGNTVVSPGLDAGVILLPNSKYLAIAAGTNSYLVSLDPERGTMLATLEIMRNVVARGAIPIGMVDSINAGNPEKPDSYAEFVNMIRGIAEFSHQMTIPVVGGNVSLYNESEESGKISKILPSPFVGIAGLIEENYIPDKLSGKYTILCVIGKSSGYLKGSAYGKEFGYDDTFEIDWDLETKLINFLVQNADKITSCRDVGRGGIVLTAAKWAINSDVGISLDLEDEPQIRYGENTPRYLLEVEKINYGELLNAANNMGITFQTIGSIGDPYFFLDEEYDLDHLRKLWMHPIEDAMKL